MHSKSAADVPVLFAFSEQVAKGLVVSDLHLLVLPAGGSDSLRLPVPVSQWHDLDAYDDEADGSESDGDAAMAWRDQWPCPLPVCRLSPHLRNLQSLHVVLEEAAAVLVGA